MATPPDVRQSIRTFIAHLIGDTDRTGEQARPIQYHDLPLDMPIEREALRIIYACRGQGVPPTGMQLVESLSLHMERHEAATFVTDLQLLHTEDRSVRNMAASINMYFDEQRQRQAFQQAMDIISSPTGTPEENFERATAIIMKASPKTENGSHQNELQRFEDFLRAQRKIDERIRQGRNVGITLPFDSLQALVPTLELGDMMLITGQPGFGKTTLGTFLAEHFAWKSDVDTLYVHLETTPLSLQRRQLARWFLVPTQALRTGGISVDDPWYQANIFLPFQEQMRARTAAGQRLETLYCPGWTDKQITTAASLFVRQAHERGRLAEVIVDYIQKVGHPGVSETEERIRIERAADHFKTFAGQENCHVTILSQESPGKTGEESSPFGSVGPKQYAQVHVSIERQRAEWDWRITKNGQDMLDARRPGQPRYWHRKGQWDARVKWHIVKANDDQLGVIHTMWENQFFRIQEADESIWAIQAGR